jgi:hypothetical protein
MSPQKKSVDSGLGNKIEEAIDREKTMRYCSVYRPRRGYSLSKE